MPNPQPNGGMDVQGVQLLGSHPENLTALDTGPQLTPNGNSTKADREFLPNLPVTEFDNMRGITVNPNQPSDLNNDPGLLQNLPPHSLR